MRRQAQHLETRLVAHQCHTGIFSVYLEMYRESATVVPGLLFVSCHPPRAHGSFQLKTKNRFQVCFFPVSTSLAPRYMSLGTQSSTANEFTSLAAYYVRSGEVGDKLQIVAHGCRTPPQLCFAASLAVESLRDT